MKGQKLGLSSLSNTLRKSQEFLLQNFLRTAYNTGREKKLSVVEFMKLLKEKMPPSENG